MKVRAHVFVSGRVQGVFFRLEANTEARKHNILGWIRNTPDGRVEAIFEGEEESVKRIIEFCRLGPGEAKVTDIDIQWQAYTGEFRNFKIRPFS